MLRKNRGVRKVDRGKVKREGKELVYRVDELTRDRGEGVEGKLEIG